MGKSTSIKCSVFITLGACLLLSLNSFAQITYTWIGASGDSWATPTSWSPTRAAVATSDIMQFNDGGTYLVTGVPTQAIRQLLITNNSTINLQSGGFATLSINGPSLTHNLVLEAGSTLQLGPTNTITLRIITTANQRGDISGTLNVNSGTFQTNSTGTTIVTVSSTGVINNNNGTVTASAATLVFDPGAVYNHYRNGSSIPTATWTATAPFPTCNIVTTTSVPTGINQTFGHLNINVAPALTCNLSGTVTVNGDLNLTSGTLSIISYTLVLNGDLNMLGGTLRGGTLSNLTISGTASTMHVPAITSGLRHFTLNRPAGAILDAPLTLSTTGIFTITDGVLTTTAANLLSVTYTAAAAVVGGSPTAYVNGPIRRSFPSGLASGSTYLFPLGKSVYNLFELVNPTTSAIGTITAEVFDADAGGSPGFGLTALNINRYWEILPSSAFLTSSSVRITESVLGGADRVAQSSTIVGTYSNRGGTAPSPILSNPVDPTLGYFVLGTASSLTLSGTYTVGATGQFLNLTAIANLLNSTNVTGDCVFELLPDYDGTSGESYPIVFYQYTMVGGPWSVVVRPAASVSSMLTTSGTTGSIALITFSGVDLLSFDGRPGGTGTMANIQWSIVHTGAGSSYPAIQFVDGACNDVLKYLTIRASCTNTTGTIVLGTSSVAGGNSSDTIRNCNIGNYTSLPYNAILSNGTAGANANANNSIIGNNIYNFQSFTSYSASPLNGGVIITATGNGSNWQIMDNSFYANLVVSGRSCACIYLRPGATSTGNIISGNYIGGQSPQCGGGYMDFRGTWNGNGWDFWGVYANSGGVTISNNTIQNIKMGLTTMSNHFCGINIVSGPATVTDNVIGSATQCKSILNGSAGQVFGISNVGSSPVTISNNLIANMITDFSNPPSSFNQCGICGISCNMPGGVLSPNVITNNEIFNLENGDNYNGSYVISGWNFGSSGASYGPMSATNCKGGSVLSTFGAHMIMVVGIYLQQWNATNVTHTITKNKIYGLNSTVTGGTNVSYIIGIFDNTYGTNYTSNIDGNRLFGFSAPDTYGNSGSYYIGLIGIFVPPNQLGTHNITNNMVQLGYKLDGSSVRKASITGIWNNSDWNNTNLHVNFYHNSVYIGGSDNTCMNSYAFRRSLLYSSAVYELCDVKNNIFVNDRSSTLADHYGIYINDNINLTSNYNLVFGTGTGFVCGNVLGTSYANLAAWQAGSGQDANSLSTDPLYVNPAVISPDLHIQSGSPAIGAGTNVGVTADFDNDSRSGAMDIGADDYSASYSPPGYFITDCDQETPLPVELISFRAVCTGQRAELSWITASETQNDYFTLERSEDGNEWQILAILPGSGNSNLMKAYNCSDPFPASLTYYRLFQTDYDGKRSMIGIRSAQCGGISQETSISCYPNPFSDYLLINQEDQTGSKTSVRLYDVYGKIVLELLSENLTSAHEPLVIDTRGLACGVYMLEVRSDKSVLSRKVVKSE